MAFIKNFYDKIKAKATAIKLQDEEDFEEEERLLNEEGFFEDETDDMDSNSYSYIPQGSYETPQYKPYEEKTSEPKLNVVKGSTKVHQMSEAQNKAKYHFEYRILNDFFDAKNVANLICEKNTLVLVSFEKLDNDIILRAIDFLDGVSYAQKTYHTGIKSDMYLYIPEGIELHGDFLSQVDIFSTRGI